MPTVPFASQGTLTPYPWLTVFPKTQFGVAQQWYVNRAPLTSRRPSLPINNIQFNMIGYKFRPRNVYLTNDPGTTGTLFNVADASIVMNGDILLLPTNEQIEIVATPDVVNNQITVRRQVGGTAAVTLGGGAVTTSAPVNSWNVGNSRTGGEKFQVAINQTPSIRTQYIQTLQHVVSVSGVMQAMGNAFPLPSPTPTPYEKNKMDALQNLMDDIENSALYGVGEAVGGANTRGKMIGLFNLIQTNAVAPGLTLQPSNPSAYRPSDFEHDLLSPIRANGGQPSLLMVSNGFRAGLSAWGLPLQRYDAGQTRFGVNIQTYTAPFLGDIRIVENMWLNKLGNCAICLTEEECRFRTLEELDYKAYGRVGDTGLNGEGDWIKRTAIELDNEFHHSYVYGITGFAPQ